MKTIVEQIFEHNSWANRKIIEVCRDLTDEQLDAVVPGTYGSIRDTLAHIASAQERYLARLQGDGSPSQTEGWPGFDELLKSLEHTGRGLLELTKTTPPGDVWRGNFAGKDWLTEKVVVFTQVINHGTEHRQQIMTAIASLGMEPPQLDSWTHGYETGQMRVDPESADSSQ